MMSKFSNMFHVKHFPPGMNIESEKLFFGLGMCGSFFYSWTFIWRYVEARTQLFGLSSGETVKLILGTMDEFLVLLGDALIGFLFVAIGMILCSIFHYAYFWQGSKSIYLMKRLPDKMEIHKRVWTIPLVAVVLCCVAVFLLLVLYYGLYIWATPKQCLPSNQWRLW